MQNDEPVLAAEFESGAEAMAAHGLLKSAGIPSFLKSSMPSMKHPDWTDWAHEGEFGNLLIVPRQFLADARELLSSQVSEADLMQAAESAALPDSDTDDSPDHE